MNFLARYLPLALVVVIFRGFGQNPATATQPPAQTQAAASSTANKEMPSDPTALLELAAKKNGLQNVQATPWHMKASYQVLDEKGATKDAGTVEEFWVSANKNLFRYAGANFNQTRITSERGVYQQGDEGTPKGPASLVRSTIFDRMFVPEDPSKVKLKLDERAVANVKLQCITIERTGSGSPFVGESCLDKHLPVLRIRVGGGGYLQTLYNEIAVFEGVYVAKNMQVSSGSRPILHVHVDMLESYLPKDDALFVAPVGAVSSPRRVSESGAVTVGNIVHKVTPAYPASAKQQRIQGVVVLHAIITPEGKISNLEAVTGPAELVTSSMEAVKRWEYKPYLLDGVPTEVETEIYVIFSIGG